MKILPAPRIRTILGFIVAPVVPALICACLDWLGGRNRDIFDIMTLLGYSAAMLGGVPLYVFLQWRRWNGWQPYIVAGALLSCVALIVVTTVIFRSLSWLSDIGKLAPLFWPVPVSGTIGTLCFWLIARPDRAEEDPQPAPSQ